MENKSSGLDIEFVDKPFTEAEVRRILTPTVEKWFFSRFQKFSLPQLHGVIPIHQRENILVSAPTGATKTLTAFLSILNELVDSAEKGILQDKIYCVYISPLKALNNDISTNLIRPLEEMAEQKGSKLGIRVGVRTGDTTPAEKSKMLKKPPHILITTPESLAIVLSSKKFSEHFRNVDWVIVDEIHAIAENKRGVHLSLSLERLQRLSPAITRVGLSATVAPLEEVAKFLVGNGRKCKVVDVQFIKNLDLKVLSPVANLIDESHSQMHTTMYNLIDNLVQENRTTLIFTNTRSATERVVDHLKNKFPKKYMGNIGAHHGSLSKRLRFDIESKLRNGELKCVVSSTSLELGIDIGFIDLVLCLGSPKSVARFLQRAGRSGHRLHETVKGRIIVMDRDDMVECAVLNKAALEKKIDLLHIPTNCLDVLAQQLAGIVLEQVWDEKEVYELVRRSYCYRNLSWTDFDQTLDYLAGKFSDLEDRYIYAKLWRNEGKIGKRGRMARVIYMTNIGTIPDEHHITVKIGEQVIGMLDEQFLERLKPGDVFVLGGDTYKFKFSRGMVAQVAASSSRPPTVPSWVSEMLPLSFDLALEIGRFRRLMLDKFAHKISKAETLKFMSDYLYCDETLAAAIYNYFREQYDYCKKIPNDRMILVENFDDGRERKTIFHTLFGRRVNDCLSRAVGYAISKAVKRDVEIGVNDNGFYISGFRGVNAVDAMKMLKSARLSEVMNVAIEKSEVYKRRFRHCAGRALMILRNYKGRHKRVGRQQVSSQILMTALKRINNDFTILKEARREVLEDLMDIENCKKVLKLIEEGAIKVEEVSTTLPSPFAFNLALMGYMDVLKIEDKHEFLRRMHQQVLAKIGKTTKIDYAIAAEPVNYEEVWQKADEALQEQRESEKTRLKMLAWNLPHVPMRAKEEIVNLIDGSTEVSEEFVRGVQKYKDEIKKHWPKELQEVVFGAVEA